ncbi:hypothetical protein F4680DRAFT_389695 [Xylaria scruposa]|nr:hypothetical protein F4680DRAFT_389695 [Xylaria scruposa]
MLIKISLFALYLRLFNPSKIANFLIWLGLSFVSAFYLVSSIVTLVFCVPHAGDGGWGSPKSFQRCALPQTYTVVAAGVVGTVVDFYILCIPLRMVSKLMLSFRKKIAIASIFLTGLVACTFSIVGTYFRFQILDGVQPMDYTWSAAVAQGLSAIELNIGLVCCCLPVSAVIWKRLYQGSRGFWDYLKGYFQSVSGIRTTGHLSQNGVQLKPNFHDRLPEIPGAQLTWLHSFFRRTLHTLPSHNNIDVSTHGSTDIESSTGLDYHNHLKATLFSFRCTT